VEVAVAEAVAEAVAVAADLPTVHLPEVEQRPH